MSLRVSIVLIPLLLLVSQSACATDRTYQGKVIDADTLQPIEGAVVVAVWNEKRGEGLLHDYRFKDAKETLTDKNGEWTITGSEGDEDKSIGILQVMGVFITRAPVFLIYKPGYVKQVSYGNFEAYPCVIKEYNLEGIVLTRAGDTKEERKKYFKKYRDFLPFIPMKEPEKKLRDLDLSFKYQKNVKKVGRSIYRKGIRPYWVYTVVGLRKARTREERLDAMSFSSGKALPIVSKMKSEERERLLGPVRREAK